MERAACRIFGDATRAINRVSDRLAAAASDLPEAVAEVVAPGVA
jgi:hypothetical protein